MCGDGSEPLLWSASKLQGRNTSARDSRLVSGISAYLKPLLVHPGEDALIKACTLLELFPVNFVVADEIRSLLKRGLKLLSIYLSQAQPIQRN